MRAIEVHIGGKSKTYCFSNKFFCKNGAYLSWPMFEMCFLFLNKCFVVKSIKIKQIWMDIWQKCNILNKIFIVQQTLKQERPYLWVHICAFVCVSSNFAL